MATYSYFVKPQAFYTDIASVTPAQPMVFDYADIPVFRFSFLPNAIQAGDTLVFASDDDMIFYADDPGNILHSASCMIINKHVVTEEEAAILKVEMPINTRTIKFRDTVNGKIRPVDVMTALYVLRDTGDDKAYSVLAKGRGLCNAIIADYDSLPEPITTGEYYTKSELDALLAEKAEASALQAHTDDADIHVTLDDKSKWDSKADIQDITDAVDGLAPVAKSGSYNDLTDKPVIPGTPEIQAPVDVHNAAPDAHAQLFGSKQDKITPEAPLPVANVSGLAPVAKTGSYNDLTDQPVLATVATTGSYNDLTDKPTIPGAPEIQAPVDAHNAAPDAHAQLFGSKQDKIDDTHKLPASSVEGLARVATTGSYNDLTDKPTIPTVPTNVSEFENDADYQTGEQVGTAISTATAPLATTESVNAGLAAKQDKIDDANKLPAGSVEGLATVATTGSYNDLSDQPTIPAAANDAKITITQGGVEKGSFTLNQADPATIEVDAGGGGTGGGVSLETYNADNLATETSLDSMLTMIRQKTDEPYYLHYFNITPKCYGYIQTNDYSVNSDIEYTTDGVTWNVLMPFWGGTSIIPGKTYWLRSRKENANLFKDPNNPGNIFAYRYETGPYYEDDRNKGNFSIGGDMTSLWSSNFSPSTKTDQKFYNLTNYDINCDELKKDFRFPQGAVDLSDFFNTGHYSFSNVDFTIPIPDSVKIMARTFKGTGLKKLMLIPSGIENLESCFEGCHLEEIPDNFVLSNTIKNTTRMMYMSSDLKKIGNNVSLLADFASEDIYLYSVREIGDNFTFVNHNVTETDPLKYFINLKHTGINCTFNGVPFSK